MSLFLILLAGDLTATNRLRKQITGARVIAADAGIKHAELLRVVPELWVGDFDSTGEGALVVYGQVERQKHHVNKNMTDGELAVREAVKRGATSIILAGAFGGQADHATAHMALALQLQKDGIACFLSGGVEEAYPLLPGQHGFNFGNGANFSIVPWHDIKGLTLNNVKWPLDMRDVDVGSTLTLSNVARGPFKVSLVSGCGILFAYPLGAD